MPRRDSVTLMSGFSRREFFAAPALIGLWRKTDLQNHRRIRQRFVFRSAIALARFVAAFRAPAPAQLQRSHSNRRRRHGGTECGVVLTISAASAISCQVEMERQAVAATRAGVKTKSRNFHGPRIMFQYRREANSLARELFEELGPFRDGKWEVRHAVLSIRRSACSSAVTGRRALSSYDGALAERSRAVSALHGWARSTSLQRDGPIGPLMERRAKASPLR